MCLVFSMESNVPVYNRDFSLSTNNLPFPNSGERIRSRYNQYKYNRLDTHYEQPVEQETSFSEDVPNDTSIQIDEFEPLLEGAAGIGETLGTLGGAGFTAGEIATGAGAILGGSALAYGAGKLTERISEKGAVLPGSEFIGPGNPINIGAAKDAAEQAAKEHDINYGNLIEYSKKVPLSQQEFTNLVHTYDRHAIDAFEADWKNTGNWKAFVGKYGLKLKVAAEDTWGGAIYPRQGKLYVLFLTVSSTVSFQVNA
nr:MAG: structural protein [Bee densovirus 7]